MKRLLSLIGLGLLCSAPAWAQDVSTTFDYTSSSANCDKVTAQDGVPTAAGTNPVVCPSGFFGAGGLQIQLNDDPAYPGNGMTLYQCATGTLSNTVGTMPQVVGGPSGSIVSSLSCNDNLGYTSVTWDGTLTSNYMWTYYRSCSGGRGQVCRYRWHSSFAGGVGSMTTPQPPPPPPPPPLPVVTVYPLASGECTPFLACIAVPADTSVILGWQFDGSTYQLTTYLADGTTTVEALDSILFTAINEEADTLTASATSAVYDIEMNLALDETSGNYVMSSGTMTVTVQP